MGCKTHLLRYSAVCLFGLLATCSRPEAKPPPADSPEPAATARQPVAPGLPNIVLFSIDTLRADRLGAYGYAKKTSPSIDAFTGEAVRFGYAISQAPSTAPAHMSIFTAMTPAVHRLLNTRRDGSILPMDARIPTLIEELKENGYYTAGFHGGGNVEREFGFDRGFHIYSQDFISYNWIKAHRDPADLRIIRRWTELSRERGRPFFLFLHHYVCHAPYISAPQTLRNRFLAGQRVAGLPVGVPDDKMDEVVDNLDRVPSSRRKLRDLFRVLGRRARSFWQGVDLGRQDHNAHIQALYDAGVAYSDQLFGQVMKLLRDEGVYDNTIVVLLSDHGEEFFEHGGREHGDLFVEHLHVPLLIKFPEGSGIRPKSVAEPVRTMDVLPTLFQYSNLEIRHPIQGTSLMPLVDGNGTYKPEIVSYGDPTKDIRIRVERNGMAYTDMHHGRVAEHLFDRAADPREQENLAEERVDVVAEMREIARQQKEADARFLEELDRPGERSTEIDERLVEQLRQLGYVK